MNKDKFIIQLSDRQLQIVTRAELDEIHRMAEEFDGFSGVLVKAKLPEFFTKEEFLALLD